MNIIAGELRDLNKPEGLDQPGELKRRIQRMSVTFAPVLPRFARDVDAFFDEVRTLNESYRTKPVDNFSISERLRVKLVTDALARLREPLKQYLAVMDRYTSEPTPWPKSPIEELIERRSRLFLQMAEENTNAGIA